MTKYILDQIFSYFILYLGNLILLHIKNKVYYNIWQLKVMIYYSTPPLLLSRERYIIVSQCSPEKEPSFQASNSCITCVGFVHKFRMKGMMIYLF